MGAQDVTPSARGSPPSRYHPALVALHWLLAAGLLFALGMGTLSLKELPNASPEKLFALRGHMVFGVALLVLIAIHVFAALWHHFVRRDGLLGRMAFRRQRA